jgi:hypothetical protein
MSKNSSNSSSSSNSRNPSNSSSSSSSNSSSSSSNSSSSSSSSNPGSQGVNTFISPKSPTSPKKVGSTFNFSNFKVNNIKNSIKTGVNIFSKSSITVNIKDIIGKLSKPFDKNYMSYFKARIYAIPKIRELKKQKYLNINMFYIDNFENYPDKYLVYIYYNYNDLYFIYDNDKEGTKLYDIGNLEPFEIKNLLNDNKEILKEIKNNKN